MAKRFQAQSVEDLLPSEDSSLRNGIVALIDQFFASATNFLTGVIVGRACTQHEFGLYMLGLSIVLLTSRLQIALISTPYMVFSPRLNPKDRAYYTGSTLIHQLAISLISLSFLALLGIALSFGIGPQGLAPVIWALASTIGFILLREYVRNICFAQLNFLTAAFVDFCVATAQISGLLFLAYRGLLTARLAFWVIGIACVFAVAVSSRRTTNSVTIDMTRVKVDFKKNWKFGKWIFASGLLWETAIYLYPWTLTFYHGVASTGVWAACFGAAALGNPILLGMSNLLGPKIAHSYAEGGINELRRVVLRSCRDFSLLVFPIAIFLFFFGGKLVEVLYGAKYSGNGAVVSLLAIGLLTVPVGFGLSRALFAMERAELECLTNVAPILVLLFLGIWLVKTLAVVGVAVGLLLGNVAAVIAKYWIYLFLNKINNWNDN